MVEMPEPLKSPTPFVEVNEVLTDLLARARSALEGQFVGLYLYGSLATGDFDPQRSDIDFMVVTDGELSDATVADLESMHMELASSGSCWARKLEGTYLPQSALPRYDSDDPPRPTLNEGRFFMARQGSDWVIQRHVLRNQECIVAGPSLRRLIDPVSPDELRWAVKEILLSWWAQILADPVRLEEPEYQPYAILSMCRALHLLEFGAVVSKADAARWAREVLDQQWAKLIEGALAWRPGDPSGSLDQTRDLIKLAVERGQQFGAG